MARITYHPFSGAPIDAYSSGLFAWDALVETLANDEDEAARFDLVEMFDADENGIEVVTFDGEPVGVLDHAMSRDDLARFAQ